MLDLFYAAKVEIEVAAGAASSRLETAKGVATPGQKVDPSESGTDIKARRLDPRPMHDPECSWPAYDDSPKLDGEGLKKFQSVAALLNGVEQHHAGTNVLATEAESARDEFVAASHPILLLRHQLTRARLRCV